MSEEFKLIHPIKYVRDYLKKNIRPDGRDYNMFRPVAVNTNSIHEAIGSSVVKLGSTTIICGIRAEIAKPSSKFSNRGYIIPNIDFSFLPNVNQNITAENEFHEIITSSLFNIINNTECIDLQDLCIQNEKFVWAIYCDILCLENDGCLLDVINIACFAALKNLVLPTLVYDSTGKCLKNVEENKKVPITHFPIVSTYIRMDKLIHPIKYVRDYLKKNIRPDGRDYNMFRPVAVNTNSIHEAIGSSVVKLGSTTIICGIRAEIAKPSSKFSNRGYIIPNIDFSFLPNVNQNITAENEFHEIITSSLFNIINNTECIDLQDLCIQNEKFVWAIYCDILCLENDGCLLDVINIACFAALKNLVLPTLVYDSTGKCLKNVEENKKVPITHFPIVSTYIRMDKLIHPIKYVRDYLKKNIRPDGRDYNMFRPVAVNTNSIHEAIGSSVVKLGSTTIICGIRAEIAKPSSKFSNRGYIIPNIDFSFLPNVNQNITAENEFHEIITSSLFNIINNTECIDLQDLCIQNEKFVWAIYCDILCLENDGCLLDVINIACFAALKNLVLPTLVYDSTGKCLKNVEENKKVPITHFPIVSTYIRMDNYIITDPTFEEECLADATIHVGIANGNVKFILKSGGASMSSNDVDICVRQSIQRENDVLKLFKI